MTEERMTDRKRLLDTAAEYVLRQRNKSYGEPDEDFQRIAAIATAMGFRFSDRALTGSDVALFMACLKLSRLAWAPDHEDSWIDLAGYAACGMETANLEQARRDSNQFRKADDSTPDEVDLLHSAVPICGPECGAGHTYVGDCGLRRYGGDKDA
jgi:Domain of unknown function (DUF6378)